MEVELYTEVMYIPDLVIVDKTLKIEATNVQQLPQTSDICNQIIFLKSHGIWGLLKCLMLVIDNAGKKKYDVGNIWQCDHLGIVAFDFSWFNCL